MNSIANHCAGSSEIYATCFKKTASKSRAGNKQVGEREASRTSHLSQKRCREGTMSLVRLRRKGPMDRADNPAKVAEDQRGPEGRPADLRGSNSGNVLKTNKGKKRVSTDSSLQPGKTPSRLGWGKNLQGPPRVCVFWVFRTQTDSLDSRIPSDQKPDPGYLGDGKDVVI